MWFGITNWLLAIPASYVIYRITRTTLALIRAIVLYLILPIIYPQNLSRFKNRLTVVTGSTDGIGKAYTIELAKRGLRNFLLIGRNTEKLEKVKSELENNFSGCKITTFLFDFFDGDFNKLRAELAPLNIGLAINSVGVGRELVEKFGESPEADTQILRVNAVGAAEFLSCVLPPMNASGGGQIVVLSSSQGIRPIALLAAYSATKLLAYHLYPWTLLKHIILPIYWKHQERMLRIKNEENNNLTTPPSSPRAKTSKIPVNGVVIRNRA